MANLRTNNLSGEQGQNAIRGAVNFGGYVDGSASDYLSVADHDDLNMGTGEFTFECWLLAVPHGGASYNPNYMGIASSQNYTTDGFLIQVANDGQLRLVGPLSGGAYFEQSAGPSLFNEWNHVAVVRTSGTIKGFVNGIEVISASQGTTIDFSLGGSFNIGENGYSQYPGDYPLRGTISNLRLTKGLARYTSTFTPPAFELTADADTVLLCCQNSDDVTQEETGKTITGVGNLATAGYNKTQPKVIPPYGVDAGNTFGGPIQQSSQGYMYFPTGRTEERGRGRGLIIANYIAPANTNVCESITIQSMGNSQDFGDTSAAVRGHATLASSTRAVSGSGYVAPANVNTIEFFTIATQSNSTDFGDLLGGSGSYAPISNQTRGIFAGGYAYPATFNNIDFITIASLGNSTDFGGMTTLRADGNRSQVNSSTRGLIAGGYISPTGTNNIEFVTIATTGNSQDFGDLTQGRMNFTGLCSSTRGVFAGGTNPSNNIIDFVTIASTGNATDFGDMIDANSGAMSSTSNNIRGVIAGGDQQPANYFVNTMQHITITTTGNAQDFGDMLTGGAYRNMTSDSHGGLE